MTAREEIKTPSPDSDASSLLEIARVFLKLGCLGFGGPAVHIAMMEEEVVRKRKWMSQQHFIDLVGATNLIPGPNSTEMTMHCGRERAGWKGLILAGVCFILPAVLITALLAWAYEKYGALPHVQPFIYGIKPAIIAVILALIINMARTAIKSWLMAVLGLAALALAFAGVSEIVILFGVGLAGMGLIVVQNRQTLQVVCVPLLVILRDAVPHASSSAVFLTFLKIGSILYGSGYVLFAFIDEAFVNTQLLTRQELTDAIAVGQFTPGPVFSSATFVGWQLGGWQSAVAATAGIFLPSFVFVALLNPLIPFLRKSRAMSAFLDSVNVAAVALIAAILVEMGKESVSDWRTIAILVAGFFVTFHFKKINTAYIIVGGALLGYLLSHI